MQSRDEGAGAVFCRERTQKSQKAEQKFNHEKHEKHEMTRMGKGGGARGDLGNGKNMRARILLRGAGRGFLSRETGEILQKRFLAQKTDTTTDCSDFTDLGG